MGNLFRNALLMGCAVFIICAIGSVEIADATLIYSAPLKNGDYGGGFKVGAAPGPWNASGSSGGNPSALGIIDSLMGVTFTTRNDVINYSLGADGKGGFRQSGFRTHGAVSVFFKADLDTFGGGQPFVDNYGFDQFNTGQATFGAGMGRDIGTDGTSGTMDDRIVWGWSTWHNNVWYPHIAANEVLFDFDKWHHIGLTWSGPDNKFEVWGDGALLASNNLPLSAVKTWGRDYLGRGSAYNFALGAIHERFRSAGSPTGVTFANLEIWDEYKTFENYKPPTYYPTPEPTTMLLFGLGLIGLAGFRRGLKKS